MVLTHAALCKTYLYPLLELGRRETTLTEAGEMAHMTVVHSKGYLIVSHNGRA